MRTDLSTRLRLAMPIAWGVVLLSGPAAASAQLCYANCDSSTQEPVLNVQDFGCFINPNPALVPAPKETNEHGHA